MTFFVIGFCPRVMEDASNNSVYSACPAMSKGNLSLYRRYSRLISGYYVVPEDDVRISAGFECFNSFPYLWVESLKFVFPEMLLAFVKKTSDVHKGDIYCIGRNRIEPVEIDFLYKKGFSFLGYDVCDSYLGDGVIYSWSDWRGAKAFSYVGVGCLNKYGLIDSYEKANRLSLFAKENDKGVDYSPVGVMLLTQKLPRHQ